MSKSVMHRLAVQLGTSIPEADLEVLQAIAERWKGASNIQSAVNAAVLEAYTLGARSLKVAQAGGALTGSIWSDNYYAGTNHARYVRILEVMGERVLIQACERDGGALKRGNAPRTTTKLSRFGKAGRDGFTAVPAPSAVQG